MDQSDVNILSFEQILLVVSIAELEQVNNRAIWLALFVELSIL